MHLFSDHRNRGGGMLPSCGYIENCSFWVYHRMRDVSCLRFRSVLVSLNELPTQANRPAEAGTLDKCHYK